MAYKKLSEATLVESIIEETNVLVEEDDEIKRVSASLFKPDYSEIINAPISEDITEEANVLIEENGEIKRVPKTEVGGAGGIGYDAVIDLGTYSDTSELSDLSGGSVPVGTVKMIEAKIAAGEMPKLKGMIAYSYYDVLNHGVFEFTAVGTHGGNRVECYCDVETYSGHYSLVVYMRDDADDSGVAVDRIYSVTLV